MILAKKRRLSQTDTGKARKPTAQPAAIVTPMMTSGSKQDAAVVNGNDVHRPLDIAMHTEESIQAKGISNSKSSPGADTNSRVREVTSPQESTSSCPGKIHLVEE